METKDLTDRSGARTEERVNVVDAVRGWLRKECRWATKLERMVIDDAAATSNGGMLAEAQFGSSLAWTVMAVDSLSVLGLLASVLWVVASWMLMEKGGRK